MKRVPQISLFKPVTVKKGKNGEKDKTIISRIWWMRWWQDGKNRRESTGTRNRREAERRRWQRQEEFERGEKATIRGVSFAQAKKEFIAAKAVTNRLTTSESYSISLGHFERLMKPDGLAEIDVGCLRAFMAARLAEKKVTAGTANRDLRALRVFLGWAAERRFLAAAPTLKGIKLREDVKLPINIPIEEYRAMMARLDSGKLKLTKRPTEWWRMFLWLAMTFGMRRGELLSLDWDQIVLDGDSGTLTILSISDAEKLGKRLEQDKIPKGRKSRTLPLVPEMVKMLRAWRKANPDESKVLSYTGNVRHLYDDLHKIAGKHRTFKNFRSSTASQLIAAGVPTIVVADWLGHDLTILQKHYANTTSALQRAAEARKIVG